MPDSTSFDSTSIYGLRVNYLFNELPLTSIGISNERRIKTSPNLIECFVTDQTGEYDLLNLYDSSSQNSIMIDKLLDYRLGNTITLDDIDYDTLNYTLAKLIYIYLNLMVNGIYTEFDTTNTISSTDSTIDNLFELYVINEAHKLIKLWKNYVDSDLLEWRPVRKRYVVDSDLLDTKSITITSDIPNDTNSMYLYKNGELQPSSYYSHTSDSSSITISIDSSGDSGLNIVLNDVIIIDGYVSINPTDPQTDL